ncbi:MAG: glycosyltransferase family 39 protein [Patescibacteria group bacterium]
MNKADLIAALIIGISLVLSITSFWNDSLIVDEIPHVGAGYGYVNKLDYRLNPEHPPLAKAIGALPLLFLDLKQSAFLTKFWTTDINGQWDFGRFFIFQSGNNADMITQVVKLPILIFFVIAAIQVYFWAKKMYGKFAALTTLTLFAFSPTILAHSRFVTTDLPALFGILLATFFFLQYLFNPNQKNLWLAGVTFGIAMLTKFSTFLVVPYFLVLALIYGLTKTPKILNARYHILNTLLIFVIGFVFVVWPVYYLFTFNYPAERQLADTKFLLGSFGNRTLAEIVEWTADKPVIRALGQYGLGLLMVGQRAVGGNTTYFLGEVSAKGWWYYFPVVYLLKEPLAWLIMLALVLIFLVWQRGRLNFVEFAMLLWIAIYWITSIKSNLNIGVRHLLPVYPFMIVLVAGQISKIKNILKIKSKKILYSIFCVLYSVLMIWYVLENIVSWPNYLSYFNQLAFLRPSWATEGQAGGGYLYVVDSNLDWGQDLKRLSDWVKKNNIKEIHLDYFGWSDPAYYLGSKFIWLTAGQYKDAQDFVAKTGGGYLAVSANFYMSSRQNPTTSYGWLDEHKPVAVIGNSIWVWELR